MRTGQHDDLVVGYELLGVVEVAFEVVLLDLGIDYMDLLQ